MFMTAFSEGKQEIISDLLELIESHYMPRVAEDQENIKKNKINLEMVEAKIFKLEEFKGKIKLNSSADTISQYEVL